jgi:hypothetical protein
MVQISSNHSGMTIDILKTCVSSYFDDRASATMLYFPLLCRISISNVEIFSIHFFFCFTMFFVVTSTGDCYDLFISRTYFPIDIGAILLMCA